MEDAESMMIQMIDHGVHPNLATYNTLIKGYANLGLVSQAFSSFKNMVDNGCKPNDESYTVLLGLLLKKNSYHDLVTNSINVWKIVDIKVLKELLEEVIKLQCTSASYIYDCFIRCLCKVDRLEEAKSFLVGMQSANLTPSEDVYTCMIECCYRMKLLKEALRFLDSMVERGYLPRLESYRFIICALCEEGSFHTAKSIFGDMLSKEYNCDEIVWKILIDGLLQNGNTADCSRLLSFMEEQNCHPSSAIYARLTSEITVASEAQEIAT